MLVDISVREVMNEPAETASSEATAAEVAKILRENGIGSLVLVDDGPVGIVTETDLVDLIADRDENLFSLPVSEFMSSPILTIEPDENLEEAAKTMRENRIKKLPVVEDNEVVGIITTTDLSNYIPKIYLEWSKKAD